MKYLAIIEGPEGSVVKWFKTSEEASDWMVDFRKGKSLPQMRYTIAECQFTIEG